MAQRCPRCSAPIEGDYKFCPACAYRLKSGAAEPLPPPSARSLWKSRFLVAFVAAVVLGSVLLGVVLFQPSSFRETPRVAPPESENLVITRLPALSVADIDRELVRLEEGPAYQILLSVPVNRDPPIDPATGLVETKEKLMTALTWYPMNVMKFETTRGQYAEYLSDIEEHRERIPSALLKAYNATAESLNFLDHVPPSWLTVDASGEPIGWAPPAEASKNLPVSEVSFHDAQAFAEWASNRLHRTLSIPVYVEWIRIARAADLNRDYPWGSDQDQFLYACNSSGYWAGDVRGRPQVVQWPYPEGDHGATPEGIWAMAGNVAEWVEPINELYDIQYDTLSGVPFGLFWRAYRANPNRVAEALAFGGSFFHGLDDCKVESRTLWAANERKDYIGFRLIERLGPGDSR